METYANQQTNSNANSVQFSAYNTRRDTFTFLKSNYKYKRRNLEPLQCHMASQCRSNAIKKIIRATDDSVTATECHSINKVIKDTRTSWKRQKNTHNIYAAILRMLLLIISNSTKKLPFDGKQHIITKGNAIAINGKKVIDKQLTACARKGEVASSTYYAATSFAFSNDDVNSDDSDEMNFQQNDVKVLTSTSIAKKATTTTTVSSPRSSISSTPSSSSISSMAAFVVLMPTLATTRICSSTATKSALSSLLSLATGYNSVTRIGDKLFTFLAAVFIAFAFCARNVAAGACWQTALDNGKCNEIFSLNITKAECCGHSQEFSYTERDLSEVEYFFATAIGGGMECAPCIESCKNIECGANKKCVKRKGRPKCICAPECGSAARRRRQHQQKHKPKQQHYRGHLHHSEQLPRDIRSLSSEITNFNLELNTRGDVGANNGANNSHRRNQNQRKMLILQSHRNHRHHHHNNHNHNQQQIHHHEERPLQVKAGKRLVIIANVDPRDTKQPTTTRRLQIISNVVKGEDVDTKTPLPSNEWSTTSMNEDKVKRRLMSRHKSRENNQLFPEKVQMRRKNHKNNSDKCSEDLNIDQNRNNVSKSNNNCNTNKRFRHSRQRTNDNIASKPNHTTLILNANDDDDDSTAGLNDDYDDHGDSNDNIQQRVHHRRKFQRKRKEKEQQHCHQLHRQHYHSHRNRFKQQQQQQKQKVKLERQQEKQKLKDQRQEEQRQQDRNNTTMTMQMLPANGATFFMPSSSGPSSSTAQFIQNVKPQTSPSMATQTDTFANSATSFLSTSGRVVIADRQHFLNHGSVSAASSTQTSSEQKITTTTSSLSSQSSLSSSSSKLKATILAKADKVTGLSTEGVVNNIPSTSSFQGVVDDLALLDGIYENFDLYGFPNQQNDNMDFEIIQHNSHPVCGTDGRTYHTECQLKKRACRTNNQHLQIAYRGHCKTSCNGVNCLNGLTCVEDNYMIPHCIVCKINCPEDEDILTSQKSSSNRRIVIDPSRAVCGVDGKTYKSICDINRMICKIGRSIAVAYPGPCRTDRITCSDINCGPKHKCLVDLLTHEPRCVSCRYKCARKRHPTALRYEEGKICGVNNHTYNSWCEMRKDSCTTGFFIDVKSAGQCM